MQRGSLRLGLGTRVHLLEKNIFPRDHQNHPETCGSREIWNLWVHRHWFGKGSGELSLHSDND